MVDLDIIRDSINIQYDEKELETILLQFCNQPLNHDNFYIQNRSISKVLAYFFNDLIYKAKSKNGRYSPNEILYDDKLLRQALDYIGKHPNFYAQKSPEANLRDFFYSSSMCGKVTNFNPVIARKIFEHYMPCENATIFDYSCGFGSRMLGALTSPYKYRYVGVDPYRELYYRLLQFSNWISTVLGEDESRAQIINQGAEQFLDSLVGQVDLSFSSPPYFNYEIYTDEPTQAYIMWPTYEEFVKKFVSPLIQNLYAYTKPNGIHIVNLEDTKRIKMIDDWLRIAYEVGFKLVEKREIETLKRKSTKNKNLLLVMEK